MRLTRFQTLLDARGADIERWPAEDRAAATALLADSEAACEALAEARALDRALSASADEPASWLLRAAIMDIPDSHDRSATPPADSDAPGGWLLRRRVLAAGWTAVAASALIGFAVGMWWPAEPSIWQSQDLAALVYGAPNIDEVLR